MIGAGGSGTFTDMVTVRGGQIITVMVLTSVHETRRGVELVHVAGAEVLNNGSTHGLNTLTTRRLPKIAVATEGYRDICDSGRNGKQQASDQLDALRRCDGDGMANCLLNALVNPAHEQRLRELIDEMLGDPDRAIEGLTIDREATTRLRGGPGSDADIP